MKFKIFLQNKNIINIFIITYFVCFFGIQMSIVAEERTQAPLKNKQTSPSKVKENYREKPSRVKSDSKKAFSKNEIENQENNHWQTNYDSTNYHERQFWRLALLDFLIPGYGMFTLEKYYWGFGYALGKLTGVLLIYFSADSYLFWKSLANQFATPANLQSAKKIVLPRGNQQTASEILTKSQVSLVWMMFAITFEIFVSGVSIWHTLTDYADRTNEGAYYKIDFNIDKENKLEHADFGIGYKYLF